MLQGHCLGHFLEDHRDMNTSKIRAFCARLVGMLYCELPFGTSRDQIEDALTQLGAVKYGESGTAAFEVNYEHFRIGSRKLRICTEDEMIVSLWGSRGLVDEVFALITESPKRGGSENDAIPVGQDHDRGVSR